MSRDNSGGRWTSVFFTGLMIGFSATAAHAQVGGGQVSTPGTAGSQSFETKEGATGLNLILNPFYRREKYQSYDIPVLIGGPDNQFPQDISTNSFRLTTRGLSAGADYVTPSGLLVGVLFTYQDGTAKFEAPSDVERSSTIAFFTRNDCPNNDEGRCTDEDFSEFNESLTLGDPLKKTYDSIGGTAAVGYVSENFTIIGTAGISRRNYKSSRREFWDTDLYSINEGKYNSWMYDFELGISKTIRLSSVSVTPVMSIGYHRENADSYIEDRSTLYIGNDPFFHRRTIQ